MKKSALFFSVFLAAGLAVQAAEPKPKQSSLMTWFENLKNGLRESSVSGRMQKGRRASAVAAVRGNAQGDDRASLEEGTMKQPSSSRKAKREKKERAAFESAIDLIMAGKTAEGLSALEQFEKNHPQSSLMDQVAEAKTKAQELMKASSAVEQEDEEVSSEQ